MILQYHKELISFSPVVLTHYNIDLDVRLSLVPTYIIVRWPLLRFVRLGRVGIGLDYSSHTHINQSKETPIRQNGIQSR